METKKKMPVWARVILILLAVLISIVVLVLIGAHFITPKRYVGFFKDANAEYKTPGMIDGAVLQGYAYDEETNTFLHTAYMKNKSASRIYVVNGENNHEVKSVNLVYPDGKAFTGHVGGIAVYKDFVWVSKSDDQHGLWVLSLTEILAAENGADIKLTKEVTVDCAPSFCYSDGIYVWVGEFNDDGAYVTDEAHNFDVAGGALNRAIVCGYRIYEGSETGIAGETPDKVLSIPNKVQGMTKVDGKWAFSTSYGLSTSHLYFYDDVTGEMPDGSIEIDGVAIPVWFCDSENLARDVELQPMAEGIITKDGKVFVSLESASLKYLFGNFTRGRRVYSYEFK